MKTVKTLDSLIKELQKIRTEVGNRKVLLVTDSVDSRIDESFGLESINISFEDITWNENPTKAVLIRCANPETATQFIQQPEKKAS
jgi:hypothetical protein